VLQCLDILFNRHKKEIIRIKGNKEIIRCAREFRSTKESSAIRSNLKSVWLTFFGVHVFNTVNNSKVQIKVF